MIKNPREKWGVWKNICTTGCLRRGRPTFLILHPEISSGCESAGFQSGALGLHKFLSKKLYHIAGFVCEVLICANYTSCCGLANINFAISYSCIFISAHCKCHSFMIYLAYVYVSVQILQKSGDFCFAVWPKRPKDRNGWTVLTSNHKPSNYGCVHHVHDNIEDDIAALLQCS